MAKNLFGDYVELNTKSIYKYLKFIFKTNYDQEVAQKYVKTYIDSRYYNLSYKESNRVFYLRVKETLAKEMNELLVENEKEKQRTEDYVTYRKKEKIIKDMFTCFDYIYFFDNLRNVENMKKINSIDEVVDKLYQRREDDYQIKERISTKDKFLQLVEDNMSAAEKFLDKYFMDDSFELLLRKYNEKHNLYSVEFVSNLRLPMIYSSAAINIAFNSPIIKEEKLLGEYALLSLLITRDIVESNFRDEYLVEFAPTLLNKKQKMAQILELIDDPALQEKINLKISYEDFVKNKEAVHELMKSGYKFALILDNSFKDIKEVEKLKMFAYIIVEKQHKKYKMMARSYKKSDKIIFE